MCGCVDLEDLIEVVFVVVVVVENNIVPDVTTE